MNDRYYSNMWYEAALTNLKKYLRNTLTVHWQRTFFHCFVFDKVFKELFEIACELGNFHNGIFCRRQKFYGGNN